MQIWAGLCMLLAVRAFAGGVLGCRQDERAVVPVRIDINRCGFGELLALPGIGPARAEAIILHRVRHGPFGDVAELDRVDGIGLDTVARLLPHVRLSVDDRR